MPDELEELALTAVTNVGPKLDEDEDVLPGQLQVVVIGNGTFATHLLPSNAEVTIGRSNRCDISVDDESISRRHAILSIAERLTIEDLGSANGTTVRGNKVKPGHPVAIAVGELVGLGKVSILLQQRSRPMRPRRLWTHNDFEARLQEECAREQRSGAAFALLHIHADRHAAEGSVEEALVDFVRDSDVLGKYGPNEYEVILTDTQPGNADDAVRRIEGKLVERGLKCRVFVACCPRDGRSPYQLAAKAQGAALGTASTAGSEIVVSDPQMRALHRMIERIAGSQIGVLLLGETGVGKEVFARAVHRASPRASGPFVEINCAALTETLLESELFGHEKGAFTNAMTAKPGLIETADGGTLLLDEVGDMPLSTQAKLLRVIEDSQLRRVGALKPKTIDVRFIAATNSDLESQIAAGGFRRDLFYRLNGVMIVVPPLRDRLSELAPLAHAFIRRFGARDSVLTPQALDLMRNYSWPGNVRELRNMVERALLLSNNGPILAEHLPVERMRAVIQPSYATLPGRQEPEGELQAIVQALERAGGNQTRAAGLLGISRRTLVNRLNEYKQIHRPRKHKRAKSHQS
jgi:DNA-binding NtrC family response regulator